MKNYICFLVIFIYCQIAIGQGTWSQKMDFGDSERHSSVTFSIGTKGYILTGNDQDSLRSDLWEWDQANNTWTEKANFPGTARYGAVGFSIGLKGYIGTGKDQDSLRSDFWEWDQATDTWNQKANFGGNARFYAVGFSIGDKGYIGTGADFVSVQGNTNDFWEYDQATDTWSQKSNLGALSRRYATGFSIGQKGYILLGGETDIGFYRDDFWEWDQAGNSWTQIGQYPSSLPIQSRIKLVSFVIGNKAYIGTGYYRCGTMCVVFSNDLWEWNQTTGDWTQKQSLTGLARRDAIGFSIGEKGYIGVGQASNLLLNDLWEYCPECDIVDVVEFRNQQNSSVFPNPFSYSTTITLAKEVTCSSIKIYNVLGNEVRNLNFRGTQVIVEKENLKEGIYFYKINSESDIIASGRIIIQ